MVKVVLKNMGEIKSWKKFKLPHENYDISKISGTHISFNEGRYVKIYKVRSLNTFLETIIGPYLLKKSFGARVKSLGSSILASNSSRRNSEM